MTRARLLFIITTAIAVLLALPNPASAHRNDESYLYLDVGDRSLSGRVELPYPDLRSEFGFELEGTPDELRAEIESELDFLQTYAADETSIGVDGETWDMTFEGYELLFEESSGPNGLGYVVLPFVVDLTRSSVPQVLDVTFTPFLDEIDDRNNITLVANDWKRGVFDEETNELLLHTSGSPTGEVDLGDSSQWKNFRTSIDKHAAGSYLHIFIRPTVEHHNDTAAFVLVIDTHLRKECVPNVDSQFFNPGCDFSF